MLNLLLPDYGVSEVETKPIIDKEFGIKMNSLIWVNNMEEGRDTTNGSFTHFGNKNWIQKMEKLDKTKCEIRKCRFKDIRHIFEKYHYKKGAMGGGISHCFGMFLGGLLVGGSVLGKPRHQSRYKNCIDIRRMACLDEAPSNSESWFLSQIIRWCASNEEFNFVLSYSDKTVGHSGTIYKAANFKNIGETTPTKWVEWRGKRYHPRSLTIERPYSYELREALKVGDAILYEGLPKIIWLYEISQKLKRKKKIVPSFSDSIPKPHLFF